MVDDVNIYFKKMGLEAEKSFGLHSVFVIRNEMCITKS